MKQKLIYIFLIFSLLPGIFLGQDTFKVGIIQYKSPKAFSETYQPLINYLGKELNKKIILDIVPEDELAYKLAKGQYDMGIFTVFPYLRAKIDFEELEVFASHTVNGEDSYSGCIMIRKESGINSLHQLKKRNFLFVKPSSTSGYKYPKGIFKERNLDIDAGFFEYDFSGGHDRSLKALMDKEVDGIAVDTRVYNNLSAQNKDEYHMLECYEIPYHAYVLAPDVDSSLKAELKLIMFDAHKNPSNRPLFNNPLKIEKWHAQTDDAYNSLRRYLRIVREKPSVHVSWEIRNAAQKLLDERGDLLALLQESCLNKLTSTQRFKEVSDEDSQMENAKEVKISLGVIDKQLHYNFYLDDVQIGEGNLNEQRLVSELPTLLTRDVLKAYILEGQLLFNGEAWFVTFGSDDGVKAADYTFEIEGDSGIKRLLSETEISRITSLNTFFKKADSNSFKEGQKVRILYNDAMVAELEGGNSGIGEGSFWDNLDNRWGVIGLLVAFISVAVGSYFSTARKRRFQSYQRQANDLLLHFWVDKANVDPKLISLKEKIHASLQKTRINENQFLILNKRIDDIERIIHEDFPHHKKLNKTVKDELDEICSNGVITEKEFSRIMTLTRKFGRESAS
ncbi:MAG: PhnD/SsuA/transferrin family substrate-binding protein [Bacteroidia bacterium]|nr:PhnD/SsuA/transferrin family substrate-binding protein [Bacteroidia bacterium]